jgi:hypothetical protein
MEMVPHMVEMNQKYGGKGLQMVGISLDQDRAKMLQVTKEKGMTWPEYFDGQVWNNQIWKQYGSNGIPFTVLVSPAGKVLYAGHPAGGLDQAIEKAFTDTPPVLVDPQVLAAARTTLDEVDQKTASGDARGAIKLLSKVPAGAMADPSFAAQAAATQKKLQDAAGLFRQRELGDWDEVIGRMANPLRAKESAIIDLDAQNSLEVCLA